MTAEAGAASPERCAVPGCGRDPETHDREVYIAPLGHDFTPPERLDAIIAAARAALATPPASPEPEAERIDRWGDKGPCGFVHPGGTPCLIERYKHPNVVAIGHRWKPTPPASPEPERCATCGQSRDGLKHRCWSTHFRRVREAGDGLHVTTDCHPFQPAPAAPTVEALRDALLSEYADDQHAADLLLDRLIELEAAVRADERTRLP